MARTNKAARRRSAAAPRSPHSSRRRAISSRSRSKLHHRNGRSHWLRHLTLNRQGHRHHQVVQARRMDTSSLTNTTARACGPVRTTKLGCTTVGMHTVGCCPRPVDSDEMPPPDGRRRRRQSSTPALRSCAVRQCFSRLGLSALCQTWLCVRFLRWPRCYCWPSRAISRGGEGGIP